MSVYSHSSFRRVIRYFRRKRGKLVSQSTLKNYAYWVEMFCRFLGKEPDEVIEGWRDEWLEEYLDHLLDKGIAGATISTYIQAVVTWLRVNNLNPRRPVTPTVVIENRDRAPTKEELRTILLHSGVKLRVFTLLASSTGIRVGALLKLKWKNVNLDFQDLLYIEVPDKLSKNKRGYWCLGTPEAREHLQKWRDYLEIKFNREITFPTSLFSGRR